MKPFVASRHNLDRQIERVSGLLRWPGRLCTALLLLASPAQAQLDLETNVPYGWSASAGTLSVSGAHFKLGAESLQWDWVGGDVLAVTTNFSGTNTCVLWIYNPTNQPGRKLTFNFKDPGGTVEYAFDFHLDYAGWRRAVREWSNMTGPKTTNAISTVEVLAPASGSGQLFLDSVLWAGSAGVGVVKDPQNPGNPNTSYYRPFHDMAPDIPLTTPTAQDLATLSALRAKFGPGWTGDTSALYQSWSNLNIVVYGPNPWDIRSAPITHDNQSQSWVLNLGKDIYANQTPESIAKMDLYIRNLLDQGIAAGSEDCQFGMSSWNRWDTGLGLAYANRRCAAEYQQAAWDIIRWGYQLGNYWDPNQLYPGVGVYGNLDMFYYGTGIPANFLHAVLFGPPDDATSLQYLKGFTRFYADWSFAPNDFASDGLKVDGTGFHHGAAYPSYMGSLVTPFGVLYELNYPGIMSSNGYANLRNVILSQARQSAGRILPNSLCGRHPFSFGPIFGSTEMQKLGILGGAAMGLSGPDPVVARAYNSYFADSPYMPFASYGPDTNGLGFYQFNYAQMGTYRRDNWVAAMRGMRASWGASDWWGSEQYWDQNWYGRFQSYGVCEVIYPAGNGRGGAGWDWRKPPGGTTILLPWTGFDNNRNDERNRGNFAGALAFRGQGNVAGGLAGVWACNMQGTVGWAHQSSLTFQKSDFCFSNTIIRLASGITVTNENLSVPAQLMNATNPVATTLFQGRLGSGSTPVVLNGTNVTGFPFVWTNSTGGADWLLDPYGTGFIVPAGNETLVVAKTDQVTPGDRVDPTNVVAYGSGSFATAWLDHGAGPAGGGYEYVVAPGTTGAAMAAMAASWTNPATQPYTVLQKDARAHVVRWNPDGTIGYVLFRSGNLSSNVVAAGAVTAVNNDCLLMTRPAPNGNLWLSLCEPYVQDGGDRPVTILVTLLGQWALVNPPANAVISALTPAATTLAVTVNRGLPADLELQGSVNTPATLWAAADTVTATAGVPITLDVLANDLDAYGSALTVASVTSPAHGTALVSGARTVTYTAAGNYAGGDQFAYVMQNSSGVTATGQVHVSVVGTNDLRAGLLAWFHLDDSAGVAARDSSGRGNHGTLAGPAWVGGRIGGALSFDGSNDYLDVPVAALNGLSNAISIAFWTYGNPALLPKDTSVIYGTDTSGNRVLNIHLPWNNSVVYWDAGNLGGSYDRISKGATASEFEGRWNHWVFTKDASANSLAIYLNGSLWHSGAGTRMLTNAIGSLRIGAGVANYAGSLDDIRIYNRALSQAQAQQVMDSTNLPPFITAQPAGAVAVPGGGAVLSVTATGHAPLAYQWRRSGAGISGATNATIALNPVTADDAGSYTVEVSNQAGVVTSDAATLTVMQPPVITTQPASQTVGWADSVSLVAIAGGTPPFHCQWNKDGADLAGATNLAYSIALATSSNAGAYRLVVANAAGSVTSSVANVTVTNTLPVIIQQPASRTAVAGATVSFNVAASGTTPMGFQWRKDGTNIAGAAGASYTVPFVDTDSAGNYTAVVSNPAGSTTSSVAVLTLTLPFADWRLNEGAGTVAADSAPVPHNGTVSGATWAPGIGGTALQFNGANNYVWYGTGPSLNGTTDFSLAAWIKTTAATTGNIIQQRDSAGFNGEYILQLTSNGNPLLMVYGNSQYQFNNIWATNALNDGRWHMIAVTRSNTVGRIYVDGALSLIASGPVVPLAGTIGVAVGRDVRNNNNTFNGTIDEVKIFNTALTDNDVLALYKAFDLSSVALAAAPSAAGNSVTLTWPAIGSWSLHGTPSLSPPVTWSPVPGGPVLTNNQWRITIPATNGASQFFRLQTN